MLRFRLIPQGAWGGSAGLFDVYVKGKHLRNLKLVQHDGISNL